MISLTTKKRRGNRARRQLNVLETRVRTRSDASRRSRRIAVVWSVIFLSVLTAAGCWKLAQIGGRRMFSENSHFVLRRLTVENKGALLSEKEILSHAGVSKGENLFEIDLKQVRANLELLPQVRKVEVKRHLPDQLVIQVLERVPVARITSEEGAGWDTYEVDTTGFVMAGTERSLPVIVGAKVADLHVGNAVASPEIFSAISLLQKCEATTLNAFLDVATVDVSHDGMLLVQTADGMKLKVGLEYLDQNLRRLEFILNDARHRGLKVASADLTVDRDVPVVFRPRV
ncbi:MAG: FtsQ-type POTRA domain-containing protein [Verrucomicrobiae bacterium]|nr:FtsQ-type POTRA domain-containing protein [Verrucomicrobiae bacterium]